MLKQFHCCDNCEKRIIDYNIEIQSCPSLGVSGEVINKEFCSLDCAGKWIGKKLAYGSNPSYSLRWYDYFSNINTKN